jgi:hypothetical protein
MSLTGNWRRTHLKKSRRFRNAGHLILVSDALARSCYLPPAPAPMILTGRTNVERMRRPSSDVWSDTYRA